MKSKTLSISIWVTIGIMTLLGGCSTFGGQLTPTSVSVTETALPSKTILPTMMPPILPPPTMIPTSSAVPTLTTDAANTRMRNYLTNSTNCSLPCWWGIMPGESTMADVQAQLTTFSGIAKNTYIGKSGDIGLLGTLDVLYPEDETVIKIRSAYLAFSGEDKIAVIGVDTQALAPNLIGQIYGDQQYNELLSAYTLSQILSMYGAPDQIFFTAKIQEYEKDSPDFFEVRLLYPELGIFARYDMRAERKANTYEFCPSNSLIDLDLISPGLDDYQGLLRKLGDVWGDYFPPSPFHKTPEEAVGMTIGDFYKAFSSSTSRCLESPVSIWPGR